MNVVVAGVPFSPNLGDGLIAELVRQTLARNLDECRITSIDLAGRSHLEADDGAPGGSLLRAAILRIHRYGPAALLDRIYFEAKTRRSAEATVKWARTLDDADLLVIGPGQLFSARTANFPTKLTLLADALDAVETRPRVCLLGVGSDSGGSRSSRLILRRAIDRLQIEAAVLRDETSAAHFERLGGDMASVRVAPDLAVLSGDLLVDRVEEVPAIYVDSVDLTSYDDADGERDMTGRYRQAIEEMIDLTETRQVVFGSNGLVEDQRAAERLAEACANLPDADIQVLPAPTSPAQIAERAASYAGTVGVRLHAVLPALALGRPIVFPVLTEKAAGVVAYAYGDVPSARNVVKADSAARTEAVERLEEAVQWLAAA